MNDIIGVDPATGKDYTIYTYRACGAVKMGNFLILRPDTRSEANVQVDSGNDKDS